MFYERWENSAILVRCLTHDRVPEAVSAKIVPERSSGNKVESWLLSKVCL